jgi:hypothetical protein
MKHDEVVGGRRAVEDRRAPATVGPVEAEGRQPRVPNRAVLEGIVFVLESGISRSHSDSRRARRFMERRGLSMSDNPGLPAKQTYENAR